VAQLLDAFYATVPEGERDQAISYLTVGSANLDYRSMTMNGEVMVTVSGIESLVGVIDFVLLSGLCEWPESPEEVDKLLPPPGWFMRNLSEFIKIAL
jgi:phosphatidylserine/phosphatidylglycerophosphate/cardiolipin synthase-like enzyme